jgi:hypothetical protein
MTMFPQEPFQSLGGSKHNVKRIIPQKGVLENVLGEERTNAA